ncbi:MAG: bacillithiol system redox-active protein YtxJ [Bacteroidia bacterium]
MEWNKLSEIEQLEEINKASFEAPVMIFKHSTSCSISSSALNRVERNWNNEQDDVKVKPFYLDLIAYRNVSNEIAKKWNIEHQSPQVLIIKKGACIYTETHMGINYEEIINLK